MVLAAMVISYLWLGVLRVSNLWSYVPKVSARSMCEVFLKVNFSSTSKIQSLSNLLWLE